jgi:hypothetical protein
MIEPAKIIAVKEYLQSEFPDFRIDDIFDDEWISQKFRVANDSTVYIIKFKRSFLDDTSDIKKDLKDMQLSKFIKLHKTKQILVTPEGLEILEN